MATADLRELEPGLFAGMRLAWCTLRRGASRPLATLLGTVLFALTTVGASALMAPAHAPRYVLRISEMDREPSTMPRPKRQLREYVLGAVFTSKPLMGVMKAHNLYPGLTRRNPRAALESFREDIEVEVYGNHFVAERAASERPRTARLAVSYRAKNPDVALAVTRDLGAMIVERENEALRTQAARSAEAANQSVVRLRRAVADRRRTLAVKQLEIRREPTLDPKRQVKLVSLWGSVDALERELVSAEQRKATFDLGSALERTGIGVHFDVVDEGALPLANRFDIGDAFVFAGLGLLFGFPLVALAVGAFSSKRGLT